ncbi:hypothetical protein [uncultured Roseobacter sp.]|uniref:hypothetical protein n=1 Tax=uncultured Roseobacter sp. TaxID=114847 RepID=UPI00263A3BFA|nr:hypothetical protein [uncultured Roseobacter sp.]
MLKTMVSRIACVGALFAVTGCAEFEQLGAALGVAKPETTAPAPASDGVPTTGLSTAEALDQTTDAERQAAAQTGGGRALGQTVASLGSPAEPGFWLKTPLVQAETAGRVRDPATGLSVAVTLIPIDGPETAGSRLSLSAMRLLEVNLTDLVTLQVLA